MSFDSQVRCDIETLDVTINNYERMAGAPAAWSRIKKLVEEKLTSTNKQSPKFPTLEEFQRAVRKWHGGLLYMPSLDYMMEHIYSEYIRKHSGD